MCNISYLSITHELFDAYELYEYLGFSTYINCPLGYLNSYQRKQFLDCSYVY